MLTAGIGVYLLKRRLTTRAKKLNKKKTCGARNAHRRCGMPDAIRTHDLQSRSLTLYPTELRAHKRNNSFIIAYRIRKSKEKSWRHKAILLLKRNTQNRRVSEKLENPHD